MEHLLTTVDNPWNPFTHWDEWLAFDTQAGYNTPGVLASVVRTSDQLSQADEDVEIENAISFIVENNILGIYRKISSSSQLPV